MTTTSITDRTTDRITARTTDRDAGRNAGGTRRRTFVARILVTALAVAVLSLSGLGGGGSSASASGYDYDHTDSFAFWDGSGNSVYAQGGVNWYHAGLPVVGLRTFRGEYAKGSYVILNRPGCLWVKISWNNLTGTVSWPPSGGTNVVSDGYYRTCGAKNTYVWLNGVSYASKKLYGSNICIGFSTSSNPTLRRYDSCHRMSN